MASGLPALAEVVTWNIPRVAEFAAGLGLDSDDIKILTNNKITGEDLLNLTEDKLLRVGMPLGPASRLAAAIAKLTGRGELSPHQKSKWNIRLKAATLVARLLGFLVLIATMLAKGDDSKEWIRWVWNSVQMGEFLLSGKYESSINDLFRGLEEFRKFWRDGGNNTPS